MAAKKSKSAQSSVASPDEEETLDEALAKLSPEEARLFVQALELAVRKRRVMLLGHLLAILLLIVGFLWALYMYGTHQRGTFIGWVFLVPFALAGTSMLGFGRLARSLKVREIPAPPEAPEAKSETDSGTTEESA
jgi:hypothetical protein